MTNHRSSIALLTIGNVEVNLKPFDPKTFEIRLLLKEHFQNKIPLHQW